VCLRPWCGCSRREVVKACFERSSFCARGFGANRRGVIVIHVGTVAGKTSKDEDSGRSRLWAKVRRVTEVNDRDEGTSHGIIYMYARRSRQSDVALPVSIFAMAARGPPSLVSTRLVQDLVKRRTVGASAKIIQSADAGFSHCCFVRIPRGGGNGTARASIAGDGVQRAGVGAQFCGSNGSPQVRPCTRIDWGQGVRSLHRALQRRCRVAIASRRARSLRQRERRQMNFVAA